MNFSQIRNVIREFKNKVLTEMFPGRKEVPKTLIFAKTDSHANDIIEIVREEFGEGNEFCKKITYGSSENPKTVLNSFRNDYYPRIAVTVDMIATGTDVKPIECLVFMRDVRSKNYYEQMLGRATRTLDCEGLRKVSPSATERKLGYVIVDAVGVTLSKKTNSRQLESKPTIQTKKLVNAVLLGDREEGTLTSLANRLIKMDKTFTEEEKSKAMQIAKGVAIIDIARNILDAFDEDKIEEYIANLHHEDAREDEKYFCDQDEENLENTELYKSAREELIEKAIEPIFNPELRKYIEELKNKHEQIIDTVNRDEVIFSDWDVNKKEKAERVIQSFRKFIEENKNNIDALNIIYNSQYKNRPITYQMINELYEKLLSGPYHLSNNEVWNAYSVLQKDKVSTRLEDKLADIVALIKFELGQEGKLDPFATEVKRKFKNWIFKKNQGWGEFTEEQMKWLRMIRDHIATSMSIRKEDLELTPFNNEGGLGRYYELFGEAYEVLLMEMNYELIA